MNEIDKKFDLTSLKRIPEELPCVVTLRMISCGAIIPFMRSISSCSMSPISDTTTSPEEEIVPDRIVSITRIIITIAVRSSSSSGDQCQEQAMMHM